MQFTILKSRSTIDVGEVIRIPMRLCFHGIIVPRCSYSHMEHDIRPTSSMKLCIVLDYCRHCFLDCRIGHRDRSWMDMDGDSTGSRDRSFWKLRCGDSGGQCKRRWKGRSDHMGGIGEVGLKRLVSCQITIQLFGPPTNECRNTYTKTCHQDRHFTCF